MTWQGRGDKALSADSHHPGMATNRNSGKSGAHPAFLDLVGHDPQTLRHRHCFCV